MIKGLFDLAADVVALPFRVAGSVASAGASASVAVATLDRDGLDAATTRVLDDMASDFDSILGPRPPLR